MKTFDFWRATLLGLLLALLGAAALSALPPRFAGVAGTVLVTGALTLAYLIALLAGSEARSGRLVALAAWFFASAVAVTFEPTEAGWLLFQTGAIWLLRSLLRYRSLASALIDLGLSALSLIVAAAVARHTGSLLLCLWSFFLVQALTALIPAKPWRPAQTPAEEPFERAARGAEAALRRLARRA